MSTRAIYGNYKYRPQFPLLPAVTDSRTALDPGVWGAETIRECSVCSGPAGAQVQQVWISYRIGTDVLPLLVNACSADCVAALPSPQPGYVPHPHTGGPDIEQPLTGR
ncbi:hypothetical protein [Longispora albida]|uniref:hypothetical protein n=1 Tax=Longispora albida TaxID=203523 RepID=UPI001B7F8206|nr:hypothetical protein [Longispora albida]